MPPVTPSPTRAHLLVPALVLAVALLAAACGSSGASTAPSRTDTTDQAAGVSTNIAADEGTPKDGGSLAWGLEATIAGFVWGPLWAAPAFIAGVATGYVALRFDELRGEAAEAWRLVMLRAFHHQTTQRLAERRRALADAVASGLRDADAA